MSGKAITKQELTGLVLATSYSAVEFLEEDIAELGELVPEYLHTGKYFYDESAPDIYRHQWWASSSSIKQLNKLLI